jgi:hypothetical protein
MARLEPAGEEKCVTCADCGFTFAVGREYCAECLVDEFRLLNGKVIVAIAEACRRAGVECTFGPENWLHALVEEILRLRSLPRE